MTRADRFRSRLATLGHISLDLLRQIGPVEVPRGDGGAGGAIEVDALDRFLGTPGTGPLPLLRPPAPTGKFRGSKQRTRCPIRPLGATPRGDRPQTIPRHG